MDSEPLTTSTKEDEWDEHWTSLDTRRSTFSLLSVATRRFIFQPAVAYYAKEFFPPAGTFIEAGCGTAESSARMTRHNRNLIGLDFSAVALNEARHVGRMDALIQADIFATPLRSQSVDGIWNLGVMEHFTYPEIRTCLREFRRVLKPGGVILLFWPAEKNASRWILGPLESIIRRRQRSNFTFFPGEISRLHSKREARQLIENEGFHVNAIDFDWRTAFIHVVIAATSK
jgi:ubiquinone/menaquinone biosynthesis C-methylase UbiE